MSTPQNFAKAEMLIRKPAAEVFEAFVNPAITTRFWFTKSSGRLDENKPVEWTWEMYNHSTPVTVTAIETNKHIAVEWGNGKDVSTVEWTFQPLGDKATFVSIVNGNFKGTNDEVIATVRDSTEGFTMVLAALKALLEFNIELKLVADRFPKGLQ